jgi:eukaryotic-like serine/threonine-protein kinase
MVGALTVIHQKGMSHGHVEAASVLATEETVKLRSDCLQTSAAGQADDVAGIGATLFHAFTQRKGISATDAQINRIPAPFAEIVRSSFARRWNLAQVANALKPAPPAPQAVPPPPPPPPPPAPAVIPPPEPIAAKVPEKTPAAYIPAAPVVAAEKPAALPIEEKEPLVARRIPLALYVGLGVLVLAIITWLVLRPGAAPPPPQKAATPTASIPATPPPAPVEPTPTPAAKKPSAARPAPAATPSAQPAANGRSVWRVIAYTYRRQQDATDMVASISVKHPNLKVEVFTPPGRSVYLVSLGGDGMDHEEAVKMLNKARSMGMPDDTYVQNFSE